MGILDGPLAQSIYAGFQGKLLVGLLRRTDVAGSGGLNDKGDPNAVAPATYDCQGFVDKFSAFTRKQAGIPETDLKVCIFGASLPAGFEPQKDDQVKFTRAGVATWYQLRTADVDPAGALWECQGFVIPEPA